MWVAQSSFLQEVDGRLVIAAAGWPADSDCSMLHAGTQGHMSQQSLAAHSLGCRTQAHASGHETQAKC